VLQSESCTVPWDHAYTVGSQDATTCVIAFVMTQCYISQCPRARARPRLYPRAPSPKSLLPVALFDRPLWRSRYDGCSRHFRLWPLLIRSDGNSLAGVLHIDESTCLDLEYLERRLCS
jgi:hypothetical protein